MKTVELAEGLEVSAIGFGGMALSHVYGGIGVDEALATLHHAVDEGVTFLDTADVYGEPRPGTTGPAGTNEELISRLLADRRAEVTLATKFGIAGANGKAAPTRGDAAYVRQACEASLRRLGTEVIDLYYMHRRELTRPIGETVAAMAELVQQGKVRHLGLSEVTADELREAQQVHPIAAVQSEWSLWSRDVEAHVVPAAAELGVGFVPYSPLGRGFLTGTLTREDIASSMRAGQSRMDENFDANQAIVAQVRQVAEEASGTAAQVALAWLRYSGERLGLPVVPIPGTRNPKRVTENAASVELTLTAEQLSRLDVLADEVQGSRKLPGVTDDWISSGRE